MRDPPIPTYGPGSLSVKKKDARWSGHNPHTSVKLMCVCVTGKLCNQAFREMPKNLSFSEMTNSIGHFMKWLKYLARHFMKCLKLWSTDHEMSRFAFLGCGGILIYQGVYCCTKVCNLHLDDSLSKSPDNRMHWTRCNLLKWKGIYKNYEPFTDQLQPIYFTCNDL